MLKYFIKVIIRNCLKFFWIFPVNPLKICFQSFSGSQPTCNPLYIYKYLSTIHPEYKYVWLVNKIPANKMDNVLFVKKYTFRWFYEILTSKVIITNNEFYSYIPLKEKTILVETWHGGGAYKKVGTVFEAKNKNGDEYKSLVYYAKHLTYYISSCEKFTQIMSESTLVDKTKFLPIGMPRNDIFFDSKRTEETNTKIREQLGLKKDDYIVLYAPTYRGEIRRPEFDIDIDIENLKQALSEKIKRNIIVLFRGHQLLKAHNHFSDFDRDVSDYPVMQELLCATDMLITDYSSSMWDFSFLNRPCFLFAPDFDDYLNNRGFYTDPYSWGFPICRTNEELKEKILSFDKEKYILAIQKHHEDLGSYENGTATKQIADLIVKKIKNDRK